MLKYLLERIDGIKAALAQVTVSKYVYLYVAFTFLLGVLNPHVFSVLLLLLLTLYVYC